MKNNSSHHIIIFQFNSMIVISKWKTNNFSLCLHALQIPFFSEKLNREHVQQEGQHSKKVRTGSVMLLWSAFEHPSHRWIQGIDAPGPFLSFSCSFWQRIGFCSEIRGWCSLVLEILDLPLLLCYVVTCNVRLYFWGWHYTLFRRLLWL